MNLPHSRAYALATAALLLAFAPVASAQDTRTVKEPTLPPACITLKAALTSDQATSGQLEAHADKSGSDKSGLDTLRLQTALDHCDKGHAVELAADGSDNAFLIGPIAFRAGVSLLIDKGVTLYASRNPESYALTPGSCGVVNDSDHGCKPLVTVRSATGSGILGDGVLDGQGGARLIVDGSIANKSWWDLAEQAQTGGHQQVPRLIDTDLSDDFTLYRITVRHAPGIQLDFHRGDGLTVWGIRMDTPTTARNTDGIDLEQSRNITITQSFIRDGDDNVALKAGDGPTSNVTIAHNHFYWGHGLSIGSDTSGGISQVRVQDLSLDGSSNGIRIKSNPSRGGLVADVLYEDVCIRNTRDPLLFDTDYAFPGRGHAQLPVYQDITLRNVRITGGGRIEFNGFDETHRIGIALDGVLLLDGPNRYKPHAIHTDVTFGPGPVNLVFTGDDSTANGKEADGNLPSCAAKFVPFPQ